MGLLDEAIRQHLELKRQHGASDEELHMQEQEALGPVRREPVEPAAATPEAAEPSLEPSLEEDAERAYEGAPIDAGSEAGVYEEAPEGLVEEPPLEPPYDEPIDPYGELAHAESDAPTEALRPEEDALRPEEEPLRPEEGFQQSGDTPSRGFDAVEEPVLDEEAVPEDGDEGEDDVLEETPEFLQETPEHDRLWFEQKPPRDFDFDE